MRKRVAREFKRAQAIGKIDVSDRGLEIEWRMSGKRRARRRASAAGKGLTVTVSAIHNILYHVGTPCQEIFWLWIEWVAADLD